MAMSELKKEAEEREMLMHRRDPQRLEGVGGCMEYGREGIRNEAEDENLCLESSGGSSPSGQAEKTVVEAVGVPKGVSARNHAREALGDGSAPKALAEARVQMKSEVLRQASRTKVADVAQGSKVTSSKLAHKTSSKVVADGNRTGSLIRGSSLTRQSSLSNDQEGKKPAPKSTASADPVMHRSKVPQPWSKATAKSISNPSLLQSTKGQDVRNKQDRGEVGGSSSAIQSGPSVRVDSACVVTGLGTIGRSASEGGGTKVSVNTSLARSSKCVLQMVCRRMGWIEREMFESGASIHWVVTPEEVEERMQRRRPNQRIARIPGMYQLCNKVNLALLMRAMQEESPDTYNFVPKTVVIPQDPEADRLSVLSEGFAILKPDEGTQGDGIFIVNTLDEVVRRMSCVHVDSAVLQSYIRRPMLLDGHKEGLVRVCSMPYEAPAKQNLHRSASHLTNYTLNKTSQTFVHNEDVDNGESGTKRSLRATLKYLKTQGHDDVDMWAQITKVCSHVSTALAKALKQDVDGVERSKLWPYAVRRSQKMQGCNTPWGDKSWGEWQRDCFHVLGYDVMFDDRGKAWLLETNCNPSMAIDSVYPINVVDEASSCIRGDDSLKELYEMAMDMVKGKGTKMCKCLAHHRPHLHKPCAIDLVTKHACISGALTILSRDMHARKFGAREKAAVLCADLPFDAIVDESVEGARPKEEGHDGARTSQQMHRDGEISQAD